MDHSPPGSSVHEIFQARILEWVAISFSRGSSQPRDQTLVSCTAGRYLGENKYCWINWVMKSIVLTQVTLSMHMETLSDFLFVLIIFPFLILFPQILQIFQTFVPISSRVMGNRKTFINHFEFQKFCYEENVFLNNIIKQMINFLMLFDNHWRAEKYHIVTCFKSG